MIRVIWREETSVVTAMRKLSISGRHLLGFRTLLNSSYRLLTTEKPSLTTVFRFTPAHQPRESDHERAAGKVDRHLDGNPTVEYDEDEIRNDRQ